MNEETEINILLHKAEELDCVKKWLDDKGAPTGDEKGNYTVIGRLECLLKSIYKDANHDINRLLYQVHEKNEDIKEITKKLNRDATI